MPENLTYEELFSWIDLNKDSYIEEYKNKFQESELLAEEFRREWPLEKIKELELDEYVIGRGAGNKSLCYELEMGKYKNLYIGIGGGGAFKFGIYYNKENDEYRHGKNKPIPKEQVDEVFLNIKNDLYNIVKAGLELEFENDAFKSDNIFSTKTLIVMKLICIYSDAKNYACLSTRGRLWKNLFPRNKNGFLYRQNYEITKVLKEKYPDIDSLTLGSLLLAFSQEYLNNSIDEKIDKIEESERLDFNDYTKYLLQHKNIILHGAPGTGKTYLAKEIASELVSNGKINEFDQLDDEQKKRIGFVQFHPSYDYTDFVEGLRPITTEQGNVGFELKAGIFKSFVEKAVNKEKTGGQDNFEEAWNKFFERVSETNSEIEPYNELKTLTGKPVNDLRTYERGGMQGFYKKGTDMFWNFSQVYNVYRGLPGVPMGGLDNYRKAIVQHLMDEYGLLPYKEAIQDNDKADNYVFIIDEINRAEISKVFGELFFSIDPGYRGKNSSVFTQYSNLHNNPEEMFYIPENVFIIGTMNDIDRSVDIFDFAMRRRFNFIEITAEESARNMLENDETIDLLQRVNEYISDNDKGGLTSDYHIGASFFLKYDSGKESKENLWNFKIYPLIKDYFRGQHMAEEIIQNLKEEFFYEDNIDDSNIV